MISGDIVWGRSEAGEWTEREGKPAGETDKWGCEGGKLEEGRERNREFFAQSREHLHMRPCTGPDAVYHGWDNNSDSNYNNKRNSTLEQNQNMKKEITGCYTGSSRFAHILTSLFVGLGVSEGRGRVCACFRG